MSVLRKRPLGVALILMLCAAMGYVAAFQPLMAAVCVAQAVIFAGLCWFTVRMTARDASDPAGRGRLVAVQVLLCLGVIVLQNARGDFTSGHLGEVNWWVGLHAQLFAWLEHRLSFGFALGAVNFIDYVVPIAAVLAALGVSARDMGLGRFRSGSWKAALVWLAIPFVGLLVMLAAGRIRLVATITYFFENVLQNGFSEEFLFRGALLGRLRAVTSSGTALVAQAILFGLWHFPNDLAQAKGNVLLALSLGVANHAVMGYAMGVVTERTGNIALPSVFHALLDTLTG